VPGSELSPRKKKSLEPMALRIAPVVTWSLVRVLVVFPRTITLSAQAGLLAHGSSYSPCLPGESPVALMDFVPVYSGGTAPGFHGIPSWVLHLIAIQVKLWSEASRILFSVSSEFLDCSETYPLPGDAGPIPP
jgi:hypothetical protein